MAYGGQRGVRETRAGWLDGREVVEVTYDPKLLPFQDILAAGRAESCADRVWVADAKQEAQAQELLGDTVSVTLRDGDDVASDAKTSGQTPWQTWPATRPIWSGGSTWPGDLHAVRFGAD